jgi:hypothetical protein
LAKIIGCAETTIADKGYDRDAFRDALAGRGIAATVVFWLGQRVLTLVGTLGKREGCSLLTIASVWHALVG